MSKKLLSFLAITSAILANNTDPDIKFSNNKTKSVNSKIIIPKNAKLYIFDKFGEFVTFSHNDLISKVPEYCVFKTIATKDENAIKKFKIWEDSQNLI